MTPVSAAMRGRSFIMLTYILANSGGTSVVLQNIWFVAAIWMGLALAASLISIWAGISVALIEILVGVLSFAVPFGVVWLFAEFVLGWPLHQAQIAGIALCTTSVAVVYAVLIEGGYS